MKNINHTSDHSQENQSPKKANIGKTAAVAALLALGGVAHGQNAATIDPKYYSIENPYEIPNLPNVSTFNLIIKAGEKIPITINNMDTNGTVNIRGPPNASIDKKNNLINNIIYIDKVGTRERDYKKTDGTINHIGINVNYQADIYGPNGDRPDAVIVEPGQTAKLSAGKNFNPNGGTNAFHGRQKENGDRISTGYTDSTKVVPAGTYILNTADESGLTTGITKDTISVIERPVANNNARTLAFATTVPGVIYKVYKASTASTDTTWTEEPSLSFVGDGNPANVNTGLGIFRIGAMRRAGDDIVEAQDTKSITVDLGTDMYEVTDKKPSFTVNNGVIRRTENVEYYIYDISGKIIDSGYGMDGQIKAPGVYIVKSKKDGGQRETNKAMAR